MVKSSAPIISCLVRAKRDFAMKMLIGRISYQMLVAGISKRTFK